MKRKKKRWIWLPIGVVLFAVVSLCLCLARDVLGYYDSYQYVRLNYLYGDTQLVDADIQIEIDLTKEIRNKSTSGDLQIVWGRTQLFYNQGDYLQVYRVAPEIDWEKNYYLTLAGKMDGGFQNCYTDFLVDEYQYYDELHRGNYGGNVTGVPIPGAKVIAGGKEYTPMLYTDSYFGYYRGPVATIGLFSGEDDYNNLIDQGVTKATLLIQKVYRTSYTIPSVKTVFDGREKFDEDKYSTPSDGLDHSTQFTTIVAADSTGIAQEFYPDGTLSISSRVEVYKNFKGTFYITDIEPMITNFDELKEIFDYTYTCEVNQVTANEYSKVNEEFIEKGIPYSEFPYWNGVFGEMNLVQLPLCVDDSSDEIYFYIDLRGPFNNVGDWGLIDWTKDNWLDLYSGKEAEEPEKERLPFMIYGVRITTDKGEVIELADKKWLKVYEPDKVE